MEVVALAAGLGGLTYLLQSNILPSEEDFKEALEKLTAKPDDPEANTAAGKYTAFVLGDYPTGMAYLAKSSDQTLKTLAKHELDPSRTVNGSQKIGMGDEWVVATRRFKPLFRTFFDRAAHWYVLGWPELDDLWRMKSREQGRKLSAARPQGQSLDTLPSGWMTDMGAVLLDGSIAHYGSHSAKLLPRPPETFLKSDRIPIEGKIVEFSAFVRSDETVSPRDLIFIYFFDRSGALLTYVPGRLIPIDMPFWNPLSGKAKVPEEAKFLLIGAVMRSPQGAVWVDDMSVKVDGKEVLKNPSFENR